jgi:hypothetical protein
VVRLGAGKYHSLAVLRDGSVVAWGDNSEGQCEVPPGLSHVVAVDGGEEHSLALRNDGSVVAWGADWNGQTSVPASLAGGAGDVLAVGAGAFHSVALRAGSLPVPKLLSPVREPAGFSVLVQTLNRRNYVLEYKNSMAATNWAALTANAGNGALVLLRDLSASGAARFYRMRQW